MRKKKPTKQGKPEQEKKKPTKQGKPEQEKKKSTKQDEQEPEEKKKKDINLRDTWIKTTQSLLKGQPAQAPEPAPDPDK